MNRSRVALATIFCAALAAAALSFFSARPRRGDLRIACGEDLAGQLVAYAVRCGMPKVRTVDMREISFLQLSDCCGTQAEFALAAGKFDMAVLCPDAAEKFLESGAPFAIAGGLVKNANVLVSAGKKTLAAVGYMNGRELQVKAVRAALGSETRMKPVMAAALPYALECDAVDAVVLDAADAVKLGHYDCGPLPFDAPSAVFVIRKDLRDDLDFKNFVRHYNEVIERLKEPLCGELFSEVLKVECREEITTLWQKMKVQLLTLQDAG